MNYANQLKFTICNFKQIQHIAGQNDGTYCPPILWKYRKKAMTELTGNGYKLWDYILSWGGATSFNFSPKHVEEEIGISHRGIYDARKELEKKHYLKQVDNNVYFYPAGDAE